MRHPMAVDPEQARRAMTPGAGGALLVCAYEDDGKCLGILLEGAEMLSDFVWRLPVIQKDRQVIFYCDSPDDATATRVAAEFARRGHTDVRVLAGGVKAWVREGFGLRRPNTILYGHALAALFDTADAAREAVRRVVRLEGSPRITMIESLAATGDADGEAERDPALATVSAETRVRIPGTGTLRVRGASARRLGPSREPDGHRLRDALARGAFTGLPAPDLLALAHGAARGLTGVVVHLAHDGDPAPVDRILRAAGALDLHADRGAGIGSAAGFGPHPPAADDADWRAGFVAALDPAIAGMRWRDLPDELQDRYPEQWKRLSFQSGFASGQAWLQDRFEASRAEPA